MRNRQRGAEFNQSLYPVNTKGFAKMADFYKFDFRNSDVVVTKIDSS